MIIRRYTRQLLYSGTEDNADNSYNFSIIIVSAWSGGNYLLPYWSLSVDGFCFHANHDVTAKN